MDTSARNPRPVPAFTARRGVNVSHWLSQSDRRGAERRARLTREDVRLLADLGFDHLRLPVDEEQMWAEDGRPEAEAFDLLGQALDGCAEEGLRAIVDLHILRSHHFNAKAKPLWTEPAAQERFVGCWRELSRFLRARPLDRVAYELLNEPVADDPELWNALAAKAHAALRETEPRRTLVIGSNHFQSALTFDRLRVPRSDPHLLLSFHFYEPLHLTHYRAGWVPFGDYAGPVRYPGPTVAAADLAGLPATLAKEMARATEAWDRARILGHFAKPLAAARATGLPLYCGEWGCYRQAPRGPRLAWYRDVLSLLDAEKIGWAIWDFRGGFALVDKDGVDRELAAILVPARDGR
jgi:endoglucanase